MAEQLAKEKRPRGRPSKYKPEYCDLIVELAKTGAGWAEWAVACDVDRTTLFKWGDEHPDFFTALTRAKLLEQVWWEQAGRSGLFAEKFNALTWKTSMQARFREDYTERKVQEVTGANGGAIKHEHAAKIDVSVLNEEQRDQLRELLTLAKKGTSK